MGDVQAFPKISIIMPTYNRANYIIDTVESVRKQTWKNWELIIVDDGSEDNTEQLIAALEDPRIQFYKAGRIAINGKIKNIGIRKATAEFIAFMDSDDLWAETKLEKQLATFSEYPDAGFSLTGGYSFKILHEPFQYFYKQRSGIRYGDILLPLFQSEIAALTPTLMFRRACLETVGWLDEEQAFSDADFILNLAVHFKAVVLYEPVFYRRLHEGNHNAGNWIGGYDQKIAIIEKFRKKQLLPAPVLRQSAFHMYINFGEAYLQRRKNKKAIGKFFKAWQNKPFSIIPVKKIAKALAHLLFVSERKGN